MADGSVIIKVDADEKAAVRKLHKVEAEIDKLQAKLNEKQAGRSAVLQDIEELQKKISPLRQELRKAKKEWLSGGDRSTAAGIRHSELQAQIAPRQAQLEALYQQVEKYDKEIDGITPKLEEQKRIYGETQIQVAQLTRQNTALENASEKVAESADRFYNRVKGLAKRVFVFTVITAAFRQLRDHMALAVKTNAEATSAFAQLKGAVLVLVQPLVELLLPALTWVAQALTKVVSVLAQLFTLITGKSFASMKQSAKALNEEKKALEGVGKAADKAAGSLAGFDEINTINTTESGTGGAGAAIQPDFDFGGELETSNLENLLDLIKMIGAGLLAWKLADGFLDGMGKFLGILIAIEGAIHFVRKFLDAWQNGIDWDNITGMLGAAAAMVTGLALAFGSVGAGIGLLVAGIAMLVLGFKDAFDNGWNLQNLLTSIAGIILTGLGIGLLVGSWIPVLIAAIAAVLLAFTVAYGEGENLLAGVKQMLQGFVDFFVGIFTGDIDRAIKGITGIFDGLKKAALSIVQAVQNAFNSFLDWLDKKTNGKLTGIIEAIRDLFNGNFEVIKETISNVIDAVKTVLTGLTEFISGVFSGDWDRAWEGVKKIFSGIWNGVVSLFEGGINAIINAANWLIRQLNKISFDVPSWVPGIGGQNIGIDITEIPKYKIPRLATGTVVPPNREFLAMLGDNKTETEVVSPLSTMKQAFMEALQESGGYGGGTYQFQLFVNGRQMAVEMVKEINTMTAQSGKSMIKIPR